MKRIDWSIIGSITIVICCVLAILGIALAPPVAPAAEKPATVEVGPLNYSVGFSKMVSIYGVTYPSDSLILISMDSPVDRQRETLQHELIHACYDLSRHPPTADEDGNINAFSPCYLDTLRRNPKLRAFLFAGAR